MDSSVIITKSTPPCLWHPDEDRNPGQSPEALLVPLPVTPLWRVTMILPPNTLDYFGLWLIFIDMEYRLYSFVSGILLWDSSIFFIARVHSFSLLYSVPLYEYITILNLFIYLFIYLYFFGCVGSLFLRVGCLWLRRAGATLRCSVRASHCGGFSCCGPRALGAQASVVVARGL